MQIQQQPIRINYQIGIFYRGIVYHQTLPTTCTTRFNKSSSDTNQVKVNIYFTVFIKQEFIRKVLEEKDSAIV